MLFDFSDHHFDAFRFIGAGVGVAGRVCLDAITKLVHPGNALVGVAQVQLAVEGHFKLLSLLRAG